MTPLSPVQTFSTLKSQIISLATALYGTTSTPDRTFDVLPFSTPRLTPNGTPLKSSLTHGAALIYYTGPASSPHVSWEMISYTDNQESVNAGAQRLLEDMQRGVGDVISGLVKSGDWAVRHKTVPDLAIGEQHGESDGHAHGDEGYSNGLGEERWGQPLGDISEGEEYAQRGRVVM